MLEFHGSLLLSKTAPTAEGGVGGRSGPSGPPDEAACTRRGRNEEEDLERSGRLRVASAGLEGSDAQPVLLRRNAAARSSAVTV